VRSEKISQACRKIKISDQTYYRWRREYGEMDVNPGQETQGNGKRKYPTEEAGCGPLPGYFHSQGVTGKK